ncbi:MAG: hypothetical protein P4L99_02255 [Chthoniobacter sp.]|nr:hypothetical protein [Chthoniobacter sp.]
MPVQAFEVIFNGYWREAKISGLPAQSGVFCVYVCNYHPADKAVVLLRLIYIGETGNANGTIAQDRLWPNWKAARDNPNQQICFSFAPVESRYRRQVAAALIHAHQPPANDDFKTNFPYEPTAVTVSGRMDLLKAKVTASAVG